MKTKLCSLLCAGLLGHLLRHEDYGVRLEGSRRTAARQGITPGESG